LAPVDPTSVGRLIDALPLLVAQHVKPPSVLLSVLHRRA
jgi:hypothetical protein